MCSKYYFHFEKRRKRCVGYPTFMGTLIVHKCEVTFVLIGLCYSRMRYYDIVIVIIVFFFAPYVSARMYYRMLTRRFYV